MILALNSSADNFTAKQIENANKIKALQSKGGKNKKAIIALLNENSAIEKSKKIKKTK